MKPRLIETFVQPIDLTVLKGAGPEEKKQFLESEWTRFMLLTGWQPNRAALKALKKAEAYALVLDQQDSLLRFGVLNAAGVKATSSFPASTREGAIPPAIKPLTGNISAMRQAAKIPVILHYWASPRDCDIDDDLLCLTYESLPGAVAN